MGHRRGQSEAAVTTVPAKEGDSNNGAASTYLSIRQSLRPASRTAVESPTPIQSRPMPTTEARPSSMVESRSYSTTSTIETRALPPINSRPLSTHSRSQSVDEFRSPDSYDGSLSPAPISPVAAALRPAANGISRSSSIRGHDRSHSSSTHVHFTPHLERPELQEFQKSTTGHLRTLSKLEDEDLKLVARDSDVVGMHGRHRLKRGNNQKLNRPTTGWAGSIWMDKQRQFLQAYEYLCHIGEAKEWIEDIIGKEIAPIVALEEALRDGVTLAEIVQALFPDRRLRIFRHAKLQFRHSDNIAIFFRFLEEIELPDLFWFELVDLYEKKNIPKVVYCIHALSWLLFRKGIVDFRIGNLVGQLQFEDHELEATQKGLDKVGAMPNFSGMGATFGAEPEPEPEPEETEEERIDRELLENEETVVELQSQIRGAMVRLRLGDTMQDLWDSEAWVADLQAKIRGDFAREIFQYRLDMRRFAVDLQSAARGFLVRCQARYEQDYWQDREPQVVLLQSLVRARKARTETKHLVSKMQRQEHGIRQLQAAIRGALTRRDVSEEFEATKEAEEGVEWLQAAIRGALARKRVETQLEDFDSAQSQVEKLQAAVRGMLQRKSHRIDRTCLRQHESVISMLQAAARASMSRKIHNEVQEDLKSKAADWEKLQSVARGQAVRNSLENLRRALQSQDGLIRTLQAVSRGYMARARDAKLRSALLSQESYVISLQSQCRGYVIRQKQESDLHALGRASRSIIHFQSASRGYMNRMRTEDLLNELYEHEEAIITLQSIARASICSRRIGKLFMKLEAEEEMIEQLQSLARGNLVRIRFVEKMKFYKENMQKVVKIQSFIRGRQQGEAYKTLTSGKNPPVGTVKNFVHLLNDSDFDFDEEIGMSLPCLHTSHANHSRI
jgi:Ras GTPase-activating-like protein IQGAP2/3